MVENIEYNSERPKLIIPEYGRHIQKMVDYAVSIEDREERNKVAQAIIGVMGNLNPHLRDVSDFQHKLWDQLFIISDFKLDADSPYPKPTRELLEERPQPLEYPQNHPKYRFYGNNIKRMIDVCISWEEGELKDALKFTIANHMKKSYLNWNKDTVEDKAIFNHLYELSDGKINLARFDEDLTESKNLVRSRPTNSKSRTTNTRKHHNNNNKGRSKKRY
ncbi:DUF4290 domain-containing protein [Galbibacter orientalis]|uniref:Methionyl-tRNA formyltransferase n=1 Tax=Galbibacter orientalis DSM 19592 TaxID=926559 RepID=I3C0L1_9FLAO|nr:DUF4290 domain-containing protein [Galbibacter orientalis]EIJ37154.1 hypothetical protein JoomaDRAFT_0093 [Galbibacter orientalis DSM 19592]